MKHGTGIEQVAKYAERDAGMIGFNVKEVGPEVQFPRMAMEAIPSELERSEHKVLMGDFNINSREEGTRPRDPLTTLHARHKVTRCVGFNTRYLDKDQEQEQAE